VGAPLNRADPGLLELFSLEAATSSTKVRLKRIMSSQSSIGRGEEMRLPSGVESNRRARKTPTPSSGHSRKLQFPRKGPDRILGAHLLRIHAEEIVDIFALAVRTGLTARDLKEMVVTYPTSAYDIRCVI
jgi:glutathione reductase (NADPH)